MIRRAADPSSDASAGVGINQVSACACVLAWSGRTFVDIDATVLITGAIPPPSDTRTTVQMDPICTAGTVQALI